MRLHVLEHSVYTVCSVCNTLIFSGLEGLFLFRVVFL